ncbi:MAG: PSP1 domain-containing protein [Sarcina sp.]
MINVVGIRFKKAGKIYYFDPSDLDIKKHDYVVVETARGIEFGECVIGLREIDETEVIAPLKKVIRVASDEDKENHKVNKAKETDAFAICEEKIKEHKLDMHLIDVEYTFDNNKVIFYFTADGRVDFRELVKGLATIFRTRIELRQIGVRDEAKVVGGLGPCGRPLCCSTFLGEFASVSIKMAKEQNLSLNPTKISGVCGRLMCCLNYEQSTYEETRKKLPKIGSIVDTRDGRGEVIYNSAVKENVKVKITNSNGEGFVDYYSMYEIRMVSGKYEADEVEGDLRLEITDDIDKRMIKNILKKE